MTQEVRVMLQLTLSVNAKATKEQIKKAVENVFNLEEDLNTIYFDVQMVDIVEIREEAEIYGTEEEKKPNPYHIDYKRQTKLDL
jgi:ribosomal protein L23